MAEALKLRAEDEEDLAVISSCLQDALVPLADMRYERAAGRFVFAVNRFRWEASRGNTFERVACGISFEGVRKVSLRGIAQSRRDQPLELLAVVAEEGGRAVRLVFAGGGVIRLEVDALHCRLEDFGEPWPTQWRPQHRA